MAAGGVESRRQQLDAAVAHFAALQQFVDPARTGPPLLGMIQALCDDAGLAATLRLVTRPERVEGELTLEGHAHVLEARWTRGAVSADVLYAFRERVAARVPGAHGVFLSLGRFTPGALSSLVQGAAPNFVMLDRDHLAAVLEDHVGFGDLLRLAGRWLQDRNQAFVPADRLLRLTR